MRRFNVKQFPSKSVWRQLKLDESFDVIRANKLARLESYNKHLYRPNTYLHKWWARRCGSTFRLILKSLVDDSKKSGYYSSGGLEGKVVVDPMMGGGTTLHEAIRLGANVFGMDVDPIPVLQAQATLTEASLDTLVPAFDNLFEKLSSDLESYFRTGCPECSQPANLRFTLYGRRRRCVCDEVIVVDSLLLKKNSSGNHLMLCPFCHAVLQDGESCECGKLKSSLTLRVKGGDDSRNTHRNMETCTNCTNEYSDDIEKPYYLRYVPLVSVGNCENHGQFYKRCSKEDLRLIDLANQHRPNSGLKNGTNIEPGAKSSDLLGRGIPDYADLFSSRQLLYLDSAISLVKRLDEPTRLIFAMLLSTSLEFNSMLCGYKGADIRRAGAIRHTFSHHAYSFPYTALENNPIYPQKTSGTLMKLFSDRVAKARHWAERPKERSLSQNGEKFLAIEGEKDFGHQASKSADLASGSRRFYIEQGSSKTLDLADESADFVVTDPPYYDSIQYSNLSAFFRVWLRKMLPAEDYQHINWAYDVNFSAVEPGGTSSRNEKLEHFVTVMSATFSECRRVLRKDRGRLIFTYHHGKPEGWAAITIALKRAGFSLVNRYVVHSENPVSVHIANLRSLSDDAILVLAATDLVTGVDWARPTRIDTSTSVSFCHDCATLLGWMLASEISEPEIKPTWIELLGKSF